MRFKKVIYIFPSVHGMMHLIHQNKKTGLINIPRFAACKQTVILSFFAIRQVID
jgi:hypothetical protein